jgi:GntR family transcriptional regulator
VVSADGEAWTGQPGGGDLPPCAADQSVLVYRINHTLIAVRFDRLDPRLPTPLYAQIADRIRVAVATGDLAAGDALPSVRALAGELRINPATVVQAYRDLAQEGLVEMRQGSGSYIADVAPEKRTRERHATARRLVRELLAEAARLGVGHSELRQALDDLNGAGE